MAEPALFEFTKNRLLPIVNSIAGTLVQDFDVHLERKKASPKGTCGEYLVPR